MRIWAGLILVGAMATGAYAAPAKLETLPQVPADYIKVAQSIQGRYSSADALTTVLAGKTSLDDDLPIHFQWPGIYIEAEFGGPEILINFDNTTDAFTVFIDGEESAKVIKPGDKIYRLGGLAKGWHRLRIEKNDESQDTVGTFGNMWIGPKEDFRWPEPRTRQIEFIGDSAMAGYGARSVRRECNAEQVRLLTDTPAAFAALAARHYDADYQINAVSGRGLIRNVGDTVPELVMSRMYPRLFPREPAPYADKSWRPQIIVIKLQADFVGFPGKQDRWTGLDKVMIDYAKAYGAFVTDLHKRQPQAAILLWWFDSGSAADPRMVATQETISDAAAKAGIKYFGYLPFSGAGLQSTACHYHFSLADHQKTAEWLEQEIDGHPEYWGGK